MSIYTRKRPKLKSGAGFTLLEFVIVITIIIVVMAFTIPRFFDTFTSGDTTANDAEGLVNLLGIAQSNAAGNRDNDHWGIHLVDDGTDDCGSTTTVDCAVLFKGTVFSGRDTSYDQTFILSNRNRFGALDDTDLYFNKRTGFVKSQYGLPHGLVGYWPFTASTTVDVASNSTPTVNTIALTYVTSTCAMSSDCFLYNVSLAQSPIAGTSLNFPGDITISAWVKLAATDYAGFVTKSGDGNPLDFLFGIFESRLFFYSDTDVPQELYSNNGIPDTTSWHHVAYTCSGTTGVMYIDNVVDVNDLSCGTRGTQLSNLTFGYAPTYTLFLNGYLDEVMIFNRALSAPEIDQIYTTTGPTAPTASERVSTDIYIINGSATSTVRLYTDGAAEVIENSD
ncbi:MAG: LamG domain-containing protein [Candidatus Komeilibacteria bacterium]|nr:LamG domain-containing protein [Candidatus Komeilibacteria bacterium]